MNWNQWNRRYAPDKSLLFGAATNDKVDCGNSGSLTAGTSNVSYAVVFKIKTFTSNRILCSHNKNDGNGGPIFRLTGTTELEALWANSSNATAISNDLALVVGVFYLGFAVYNWADTQPRLYIKNIGNNAIREAGYAGGATNGSGTLATTISDVIGNNATASPASAFQGNIGLCCRFSRVLTVPEMNALSMAIYAGQPNPVIDPAFYIPLGKNIGPQLDLSGRGFHGTITGATLNEGLTFSSLRTVSPAKGASGHARLLVGERNLAVLG